VVFEHITTADAVAYVRAADAARLAATITPHHLVINRNALFAGGIRPHLYCLPVAKRERHRLALVEAACSGDAHFFLGTDSAPHTVSAKESGIYNSSTAVATYLAVFEAAGALERFAAFASLNGPRFYGLPVNPARVRYERGEAWRPEPARSTGAGPVTVFDPPCALHWRQVVA
jgi:dihydroorotase